MYRLIPLIMVVSFIAISLATTGLAQQPLVERYLMDGKLTEGQLALERHLAQNRDDNQAQFGLGTLRFLQAVEHLAQSWHKFGANEGMRQIPFIRLPVPENPDPQQATYQDIRNVFKNMVMHLDSADKALASVTDPNVKLPLHLLQIRMDLNQDGKLTDADDLTAILRQYLGPNAIPGGPAAADAVVVFDYGDAIWLRGYTHLLRSMLETSLAYDMEPLWDVIAHRVFGNVEFKYKFLEEEEELLRRQNRANRWYDQNAILDLIASIHNLNFKLKQPERLKRAHGHLKKMAGLSRQMWAAILQETDDDREWIPGPNQTGALTQARVSKEMIDTWQDFLVEFDEILDGKKLLPFWRGTDPTRGVNLRKAFLEPRDLDVVLWIHGVGAMPYVEYGDVTKTATWNRFNRVFQGQFVGFAIWFN